MLTSRRGAPYLTSALAAVILVAVACDEPAGSSRAPALPGGPDETTPPAGTAQPSGTGDAPSQPQPQAPAPGSGDVDPGPPAIQLIGRFDARDPAGPKCAWPACRIVARFSGTRVSVRLKETLAAWMVGGPSEWDVAVDGAWQPKIVTSTDGAVHDYAIAEALPAGTHVVELYKRTEAQHGTTQFLGYDFGEGTLLAPPARKARRIEIIGDSALSGFGVEGVGPDCPGLDYAAQYQTFRKSMGARLGELFGAEVAGTVYSGKGMAKNIWTSDKDTLPVLFPRIIPTDETSAWSFDGFVPHVVVMMVGGNDFALGQPVDEGPATAAEFATAYEAFVVSLRERYPAAHVFLTVSPSVTDRDPPGRATRTNVVLGVETVTARRNAAGDAKVFALEPGVGTTAELSGCESHGNAQYHDRVAQEIATHIKAQAGW